jgi:hypothetical protein
MKLYLQSLMALVTASLLLAGCKKDEYKIYYEGGTPPVLTASRSTTIPMSFATAGAEAIRLNWTNPNYRFTTGSSSQNVSYQLQVDTVGGNFASRNRATIAVTNDLSRTFTQDALNDVLLNTMELRAGRAYNLEMRVVATLAGGAAFYNHPFCNSSKSGAIHKRGVCGWQRHAWWLEQSGAGTGSENDTGKSDAS